ncbi:MAG TPA: tetratricopeptide repeat protein [Hyphomicrobiaceae bacterium]|nr:tetratricopeptide repeat protein [Hyphomicrobiaceae bacterium]
MTRSARLAATLGFMVAAATWVYAEDANTDCFGKDSGRRIEGCTALIDGGGVSQSQLADVYAMRALAYSLRGEYATAIQDYDAAINMRPDFAVALNNRAWAYYRWGKADAAIPDVEASLRLEPRAGYTLDTRAHIRQSKGDAKGALNDYTKAMYFGGREMTKLYQCGLTEAGLYEGRIDGIWRRDLQDAMERCVVSTSCDPLPADEHCRPATS